MARANQCSYHLTSLEENRVHSKKKTYGYRERDETKRQAFMAQLSTLPLAEIVYVEEAGMDSRDDYAYGWNQRGQRFHALKSWQREDRVNMRDCRRNYSPCNSLMIAALCNQHLIAPFTVDGACNRAVFETWLEACLLPVLKAGQVVVMDMPRSTRDFGWKNSSRNSLTRVGALSN